MKPFRGRRRESTGERMLAEEVGTRRAVGLSRPRSRRRPRPREMLHPARLEYHRCELWGYFGTAYRSRTRSETPCVHACPRSHSVKRSAPNFRGRGRRRGRLKPTALLAPRF